MALATLQHEVDRLRGHAVRFSVGHASDGPLGKRIQKQMRVNLKGYFDVAWAAMPWQELKAWQTGALARQGDETVTPAIREVWRSQIERVLAPTFAAISPVLIDALFGPKLFAYFAGGLRVRVTSGPRERRLYDRAWAAEFTEGTSSEEPPLRFATEGAAAPLPPAESTLAWLAQQSESVEATADRVRGNAARKVAGMNNTSKERLALRIADGTKAGKDIPEIARDIRKEFPGMTQRRARLIALNETNEAMSAGAEAKAEQMGAEEKDWQTMGDDRVTAGCQENGGQGWIGFKETFASGHTKPPRFPGCRCAVLYRGGRVPPAPPTDEAQRVTPELLDEALKRVVGELPGHTYKNGITVPPVTLERTQKEIAAALGRMKRAGWAPKPGGYLPTEVKPKLPKPKPEAQPTKETWKKAKTWDEVEEQMFEHGVNGVSAFEYSKGAALNNANELGRTVVTLKNRAPKLWAKIEDDPIFNIDLRNQRWISYGKPSHTGPIGTWSAAAGGQIELARQGGGWRFRKVSLGKYHSSGGPAGTVAHEIGHHVWGKPSIMSTEQRQQVRAFYDANSSKTVHRSVSAYGATDAEEMFCEALSAYLNPNYASSAKKLPKALERIIADVVGD